MGNNKTAGPFGVFSVFLLRQDLQDSQDSNHYLVDHVNHVQIVLRVAAMLRRALHGKSIIPPPKLLHKKT